MSAFLRFILLCSLLNLVRCELFTSLAHMERALIAEREIASRIHSYVEEEKERLAALTRLADELEDHSDRALDNPDFYLGNPVNAFLFMKRFTVDWEQHVDDILKWKPNEDFYSKITALKEYLPTYEDLNGAVAALLRLQDTYKLDTEKIAAGDIAGIKTAEMSAVDCYEVGRVAYNDEDYYHTASWMNEALNRLDSEKNKTVNKSEIIDYLAFAVYQDCLYVGKYAYSTADSYHCHLWLEESLAKDSRESNKTADRTEILDYLSYITMLQGNVRHALDLTNELLSLVPNHSRARNNKDYYLKMIKDQEEEKKKMGDDGSFEEDNNGIKVIKNEPQKDDYRTSDEFVLYERLCRNEHTHDYKDKHKLKCQYRNNNHPLLMISPAKEEEVYLDPYLVLYHDVLSQKEVDTIKHIATPKLGRATVHNAKTGKLEFAQYRISKSAWLKSEDDVVIQRVNNRISAVTGLEMETAEDLQIANYGIGGHYEPHFDFARGKRSIIQANDGNRIATFLAYREETNAFQGLTTGNRIATWLSYMNDVEAGGATVFPYLGVKLFPKKGTAAFWYNLYKNGEGIYNTRHAACPVLVGTKWVSNKWIHERGQEFRRPCGLLADQ